MNLKSIFFLSVLLIALQSTAMFAAIYKDSRNDLDSRRRTHFVIAGVGKELLTMTQEAALTKALYLKKVFPHDQVILLSNFVDPEDSFQWTQLQLIYYSRSPEKYMQNLSVVPMIDYMDRFQHIASIEIFSHSNIHNGAILSPEYVFGLHPNQQLYAAKLKDNFTTDAYAILFGCNSGWSLAPQLSETWGIPVAGSFTGSLIERIGPNNQFYDVDSKDVAFPESNLGVPCQVGACLRMVVQNAPYRGYWGSLEVDALNFYKFFCKGMKDMVRCHRGMAHSILGSVHGAKKLISSGRVDILVYRQIVNEFLCSKNWQGSRDQCINFLNSYDVKTKKFTNDRTSFFMLGGIRQLHATFQGHNYEILNIDDVHVPGATVKKYIFKSKENIKNVDTLAREFEAYMQAFEHVRDLDFFSL